MHEPLPSFNAEAQLLGDDRHDGPSSIEDFWMFFTFAMILLVFVLMNYVNYLNSLVVEAPMETRQAAATEPAAPSIDIVVHGGAARGSYTTGDSPQLDAAALRAELRRRLTTLGPGPPIAINIRAPGTVPYDHVFAASHAAWELAAQLPAHTLNVHLVYEPTGEPAP